MSLEQLKSQIDAANKEFPCINFKDRLRQDAVSGVAVVAEIKRASPSKGDIAAGIVAGEQGLKYAQAGCSGISVLTEPKWFKGTLDDMRDVRRQVSTLTNRPAVLRKDFLLDEYQIYEARVYGADTVLLIVAVLEEAELTQLIACARTLGMEPLVEVNNDAETKIALRAGAKVIGVNNRNLHDFKVDASTTEAIMATNKQELDAGDCMLCALSGIQNRVDVQRYQVLGVEMVLVGEALMRTSGMLMLIGLFCSIIGLFCHLRISYIRQVCQYISRSLFPRSRPLLLPTWASFDTLAYPRPGPPHPAVPRPRRLSPRENVWFQGRRRRNCCREGWC